MIYEAEIPYGEEFIYVSFELDVAWVDNSFSYSYGSINGVHDPGSGYEITGEKWDRSIYTPDEKLAIEGWLKENIHKLNINE
jgi:hypothetical protein